LGQNIKRHADPEEPLEVSGLADTPTHDEQQEPRHNIKGVVDVTSLRNCQIVDDLQERREVVVPAVIRNLISKIEETSADKSAISQEVELEEWYGRKVNFVEGETNKKDEANDDHCDDVSS
jgi:hypothetical protein